MKPVNQTRFGDPEGNCFAACVASILECELSDLPDFKDQPVDTNWLEWFNSQLQLRVDFGVVYFELDPEPVIDIYLPVGSHVIASGPGKRGLKHSVVMKSTFPDGIHLVHDPHPEGGGLEAVTSVCLLMKL